MTFYKDEKKRLGHAVFAIIVGILFFYYGEIQGQIPPLTQRNPQDSIKAIKFTTSFFIYGCLVLPIYLNEKLFFIKERGENAYLISKYAMTPLTKKELYTTKLRILIEITLLFFVLSVSAYCAILIANDYWFFSIDVLLNIGYGFLWLLSLTVLITVSDIYRGIHIEKSAAC